ncbi:PREDICTED: protein trichome birefringence-like 6 [Ipomoea nil]|uniref:protein trichome birefringence-like 6 n=1 Tax=Ipomoea nil TaxID=35883 RepID=UPI0009010E86|nr:PREDICTED: protein trichome birefringence-like 6 [Ipomoea nil]
MAMEKQRSFSIKPTRLFIFSSTVSISLIFLIFFSVWVFKLTPFPLETHFQFNGSATPSLGFKPFSVQALTGFTKNSFLVGAHFGTAQISGFVEIQGKGSENGVAVGKVDSSTDGLKGNFTAFDANLSSIGSGNGAILTDTNLVKSGIISDFAVNSSENVGKKNGRACDVTKGKWVFDESYPLYTHSSCPFIDEGFSCEANGRLDKDYPKWRWQPRDCDIPRFNATNMLELIRRKRLVFVGDSIGRNQWESMLCLLMGAIKDPSKVYETRGRRITKGKGNYSFKFADYECTVEFYVTHFLVHESKARVGKKRVQTLRIDAVDKGSSRWRGADILVFNTAHWWSHHKTKAGINYYQEGDRVHPRLDGSTAFRKALMTWASWVERYINPRKTRVFFRSSAPSHFSGGQWNTGGHCREASRPLNDTLSTSYPEKNMIVEQIVQKMKTPVTILNITGLSDYRIDGHPSIYGRKPGSSGVQDCSHWCLPGVPDTWNEMLYYHMQLMHKKRSID